MKGLVIGASGLVGSRYVELFSNRTDLLTPTHTELDVTNSQSVRNYFTSNSFDTVINFAAYTNLGEAEKERDNKRGECWKLNVAGIENILAAIEDRFLLQISTDNVFSGYQDDPGPYSESHGLESDSSKVTWYGFTKAEAEKLIGNRGTILRLIYPVRAKYPHRLDYIRKPLDLYRQSKLYPLFNDQRVSMTFIDEACQAMSKIIDRKQKGIFHASSSDLSTPYEIIKYAANKFFHNDFNPQSQSIDTMENKVRYPKFGGLRVAETEKALGMRFSPWKEIVGQLIEQGIGNF